MSDLWLKHRDKLTGGWKCVSYEVFDGEDSSNAKLIAKPHGDSPIGRSYLSPNGYLSAHLATPSCMQYSKTSTPWTKRSDAEIANVARGLSMYCGYMELFEDSQGLYWKTKVAVASDPTRVGGFQVRRVEPVIEEGQTFKIVRPVDPSILEDGKKAWSVLKWQRVETAA